MKKFLIIISVFFFSLNARSQIFSPPSESFGDTLNIGFVGNLPEVLNPYQINRIEDLQIIQLVFGTGLIQTPNRFGGSLQLVDNRQHPEDKKKQGFEWKFDLKRNINYHTEYPLVSLRNSDVVFTFNILKKYGGDILNRTIDFSNIETIREEGDLGVEFYLKEKDTEFESKLNGIPILSSKLHAELNAVGYDYFRQNNPLGYGPFRFKSKSENKIRLGYHQYYVSGRPFLDGVVYHFFEDEQELVNNFIRGNIDLIEARDFVTAERLHQILKNKITVFPTPRPEKKVYYINLNVKKFPFNDRNNRIALRSAINRNDLVKRFVPQNGFPAYSLIFPENEFFYSDFEKDDYEPQKSLKTLLANQWKINNSKGILEKRGEEFRFELIYEKNSTLEENIARSIKIYLADLGINVLPKPVPPLEKSEIIAQNNYDAVLSTYSYFDSDSYNGIRNFYFNELRKDSPFINYQNSTIESLFKRSNSYSNLSQLLQRVQYLIHQDAPAFFLFFDETIFYALYNRFESFRASYKANQLYQYRLNPFENWFVPKAVQKYSSQ